jgi:hypothetical protein
MGIEITDKIYSDKGKDVSLEEVIDQKISEVLEVSTSPVPIDIEEQLGPKEIFRRNR